MSVVPRDFSRCLISLIEIGVVLALVSKNFLLSVSRDNKRAQQLVFFFEVRLRSCLRFFPLKIALIGPTYQKRSWVRHALLDRVAENVNQKCRAWRWLVHRIDVFERKRGRSAT